jgi:hypothetical protein
MIKSALQFVGRTTLAVSLTIASAQAGEKLTWFGEATFSGAYPQATENRQISYKSVRELMAASTAATSGTRLLEQQLALDSVFNSDDLDNSDTRRIRSEVGLAFGEEAISVPIYYRRAPYYSGEQQQLGGFGIKWRHRFEGTGSLTVLARYGRGEYNLADESSLDAANRLASVSWTSGFANSGVTGSFYIGDEQVTEAQYADSARMIYGFAVGGHWLLADEHTPYVSLRYQNSDQAMISGLTDYDKYTRISAGWNWQVNSSWRVRAEANFTYDQPRWNLLDTDRTRIQFSTRYDIR